MFRKFYNALLIVVLLTGFVAISPVSANPPAPDAPPTPGATEEIGTPGGKPPKPIDQPNIKYYQRNMERQRLMEAGQTAEAAALAQTGTDRVLVLLVEFPATDVITWHVGDKWDPLGIADPNEFTGTIGDCSKIITETTVFTYTGPVHNEIERPRSPDDRSSDTIWTEDFNKEWFESFMFKEGVVIDYTMQDGTPVFEDFTGQSVADYYSDLSGGVYTVTGDILGWLPMPHSTWWYDADVCPGSRSGVSTSRGAIPGAGTARTLVQDAVKYINEHMDEFPGFDWKNYDLDGDGFIDRLWIVHAGLGEEDSPELLNRTSYGEAAVWSHSASVSPALKVTDEISINAYIMMPENGGIGVFAHEYGHNLGADDLYAYADGETSAGFWTLMADDWTGYPIGYEPPAVDPWHLDNWGWLNPLVIDDPTQEYIFTLGQASRFPGGEGVYRGAKIVLPNGRVALPIPVWEGENYWWSGKSDLSNLNMSTVEPIAIPADASNASLSFDMVYNIEDEWDFLWVMVSEDGENWVPLTNANTQCEHDPSWIGGEYGFPTDLCGAGMGGFYGHNASFPEPDTEVFDLSAYAGKSIYLQFWYMTDWASSMDGAFVDNIIIEADGTTLFADNAESGNDNWEFRQDWEGSAPWLHSNGSREYTHNFYLQWRNTNPNGGYDSALGDPRWRFGPANTGLLVWYNNNFYTDNEIDYYMLDDYSVGPKGRMLVVDSHSEPYRDPNSAYSFNARGNITSRGQMRDAPFTLTDTVNFTATAASGTVITDTAFLGRPAVSSFHDSYGYYPGFELTKLTPTGTSTYYTAKAWDASVVMPSTKPYSVKGPANYPEGASAEGLVYWVAGGWYFMTPAGYGPNLGSGNPGDVDGQYGWHVELLSESEDHTTATVRVWNSMKELYDDLLVSDDIAGVGQRLEIEYEITENIGGALDLFACVPIDTSKVEYVIGSVTNGAVPLPFSCETQAEALAQGGVMSPLVLNPQAEVKAVGWTQHVGTGTGAKFGFQVETKQVGTYQPEVILFDQGELFGKKASDSVLISPIASFDVSDTFVLANEVVTFTNTSQGEPPMDYLWDFGDGITSTLESVTHTFAATGVYTVSLTVTNVDGTDTAEAVVMVGEAPTADFTASSDKVKVGEAVVFTNTSTGTEPLAYEWDFGDEVTSTEKSPTHVFTAEGTYTVTLTATNDFGTDTQTMEVTVVKQEVYLPLVFKAGEPE